MRLMVLSLQRIGDWLQTQEVLEVFLRENNMTKEDLYVVLQESSRPLKNILPTMEVSFFPRSTLTQELVEIHGAPGEAQLVLQRWLAEIKAWKPTHFVDLAPNRTSQVLSSWLQLIGVVPLPLRASYVTYLNETWVESESPVMPWIDVLSGLLGQRPAPKVEELNRNQKRICLQLTTSDVRKDWPLDQWLKLGRLLSNQGYEVLALVAPFEAQSIMQASSEFEDFIRVCSLTEAREILGQSDLLISGDTAMVHLSSLTRTPLICIFQGPANPSKIMPNLVDSWIVQGEVDAFQVFRLAESKLHNAELNVDNLKVSIVRQGYGGRLLLKDQPTLQGGRVRLRSDTLLTSAQRIALDQVVWGFYLDEKFEEVIPPYGSAVHELFQIESFLPSDAPALKASLSRLEFAQDFLQIINEKYLDFCRNGHESDIKRARILSELTEAGGSLPLQGFVTDASRKFLRALQSARSESDFFKAARGLKEGISEMFLLLQIQRKLMHGLMNKLEERSHRVSRAREVSAASAQ
jgi:hypothetical protein